MNFNTQALRDFSEDINRDGFDLEAGKSWIYPTNYPLRDYQYNIVAESLYKNTLVSLPTGLGKTFIAAVVMFNFYRWYPSGKIIFMAPTRPLVKQQIDACYNIMAIPKEKTAELTGTKIQTSRMEIWMSKRVFFITPQVLQNDLNVIPDLGKQIKCIVIDEAHKAKGNYAYCEVIRQIIESNKYFRLLALSATPGGTINDVSEIVKNLLISHLEFRTEDSPDVKPFVFQRTMEKIVVPLGDKLQSVKTAYLQILEKYTRVLVENRVIPGNNCANLTKGRMFMLMKDFQEQNKHTKVKAYGDIMRNLNLCITLYHGYELLTRHGLRGFLNYFEEHSEKALLRGNVDLHNIMMDVEEYLGPKASTDVLPDGTVPDMSPLTKFGHPKFYKLQDILLKYFSTPSNTSSKVIIFTEYRDSVMEIFSLLIQHTPVIKPKFFLGQSSITQKQQINALKSFRSGEYNTLISTCIGEEGLDIGEVDLIICFDISNKSPIRLVQRMGRTGRKKEGKIIVLVTEGKEEEILKECLVNKHYLSKNILKSMELHLNLYQHNPRMVPETVTPVCQKIYISLPKDPKTKGGILKSMLNNMIEKTSASQAFSDIEVTQVQDRIPEINMIWNKGKDVMNMEDSVEKISFSKHLERLRIQQQINTIGHSKNCHILTSLLQYADSKRYNIPITQKDTNQEIINKKNKFGRCDSSDSYKQSDIRTMFLKSQRPPSQSTLENDVEDVINIIEIDNSNHNNGLINELHNEISTNISLSCLEETNCKICANLFTCYRRTKIDSDLKLDEWIQPSFSIIEEITLTDILSFKKSLKSPEDVLNTTDLDLFADFTMNEDWDHLDQSFKSAKDKSHLFSFEPPKSAKKILEKSNISPAESVKFNSNNKSQSKDVNFKYHEELNKPMANHDSPLSFFKLGDVSNLFQDDDNEAPENMNGDIEMHESPSLLKFSQQENTFDESPLISTFTRTKLERNSVSRKLFSQNEKALNINQGSSETQPYIATTHNKFNQSKPKLSNLSSTRKSNFFKSKTNSTSPQLQQCSKSEPIHTVASASSSNNFVGELFTNISDFCDLSVFGLDCTKVSKADETEGTFKEEAKETVNTAKFSNYDSDDLFSSDTSSPQPKVNTMIVVNDICDLSFFGISNESTKISCESEKTAQNSNNHDEMNISPILIGSIKKNAFEVSKTVKNNNNQDNESLSPILTCSDRKEVLKISNEKIYLEDAKLTKNNVDHNEDSLSPLLGDTSKRNSNEYNRKMETNEKSVNDESFIYLNRSKSQKISNLAIHDISDSTSNTKLSYQSQHICSPKLSNKSFSVFKSDEQSYPNQIIKKPTEDVSQISETEIVGLISKYTNLNENEDSEPQTISQEVSNLTAHDMTDFVFESTNVSNTKSFNQTKQEICVTKLHNDNISSLSKSEEQSCISKSDKNPIEDVSQVSITQIVDIINKNTDADQNEDSRLQTSKSQEVTGLTAHNVCDFSLFGIDEDDFVFESANESNIKSSKLQANKLLPPKGKRETYVKKLYSVSDNSSSTLNNERCSKKHEGPSCKTPLKERQSSAQKKYNFAKRKRPLSPPKCDSEDEFEDSPAKSSGWIHFGKKTQSLAVTTTQETPQNTKPKKRKKTIKNPFIDNEAVLDSSDEVAFRDSQSEGGASDDDFESSFVNDRTQNTIDIHGKYLQTTRSPIRNRGVFKIPKLGPIKTNIFSQEDNYGDNTYLNDTFCVDDDVTLSQNKNDLSQLEIAELILEEKRKRKPKKQFTKSRRKVIVLSSDSD